MIEERFNKTLDQLSIKEKKKILNIWKTELEKVPEERKEALKELIADLKEKINKEIREKREEE